MDLRRLLAKEGIDTSSLEPFLGKQQTGCWQLTTTGENCLSLWQDLRKLVDKTGHWPVILGDKDSLRLTRDSNKGVKDWDALRAEILEEAARLDGGQWFKDQRNPVRRAEEYRRQAELMSQFPGTESMVKLYLGFAEDHERRLREEGPPVEEPVEWPVEMIPPNTSFAGPFVSHEPDRYLPKVWLGLAPTVRFWELPAYFTFGAFNSCPHAPVHVAVLRHWQQTYAIELVTLTHDTIEVSVGRLPESREQAIALARDQATYAEFDQSQVLCQTGNLAAHLLQSTVWQFWWD